MLPRWVWDYIRVSLSDMGYAEVRGWRYDVVGPRYVSRPSVSDVSSPCPTKRDVYLRKVMRIRVDSEVFALGKAVHEVFLLPFMHRGYDVEALLRLFRRLIRGYTSLRRYWRLLEKVFKKALALSMIAEEEQIPISVEPRVPGGAIGLSDFVKPDLLLGFIPIDVVLTFSGHGLERKEIALAGYALAIESWTGHPVDVGVVIGVHLNGDVRFSWRVVRLDDALRRRFLELRDEVARILEYGEDPGIPSSCPQHCPYRGVCWR